MQQKKKALQEKKKQLEEDPDLIAKREERNRKQAEVLMCTFFCVYHEKMTTLFNPFVHIYARSTQ